MESKTGAGREAEMRMAGRGVQAQRKTVQDHVSPQDQPRHGDLCGPKPCLKGSELSTATDAPKHMTAISLGKRHMEAAL